MSMKFVTSLTRVHSLLLAVLLISGCSSVQFEGEESAMELTPQDVANATAPIQGSVVWGGRIVAIENLADGTEFQVLAVPLDGGNVPQIERPSIGRFIVVYPGFLEPQDYAPGRFVTLAGQLDGVVEGSVGEVNLMMPLVRSSQIHLWSQDLSRWNPRWNFGLGVGITL
jgi:outer membrane lipoprotein